MKTYKEFHGDIDIKDIGKRLREIARIERTSFKILTGYGSTGGRCKSKDAAIKSLTKMKKEGLIVGFFLVKLRMNYCHQILHILA